MGWTCPCITTPNLHRTNTKRNVEEISNMFIKIIEFYPLLISITQIQKDNVEEIRQYTNKYFNHFSLIWSYEKGRDQNNVFFNL